MRAILDLCDSLSAEICMWVYMSDCNNRLGCGKAHLWVHIILFFPFNSIFFLLFLLWPWAFLYWHWLLGCQLQVQKVILKQQWSGFMRRVGQVRLICKDSSYRLFSQSEVKDSILCCSQFLGTLWLRHWMCHSPDFTDLPDILRVLMLCSWSTAGYSKRPN